MDIKLLLSNSSILLIIIGIINLLAIIIVGIDKNKSLQNDRRIPEIYFFVWGAFLSAPGALLGMLMFRHKIRKIPFLLGIVTLAIQQLLLIYLLMV